MCTWAITNQNVNERQEKQAVQSFQWYNWNLAFMSSEHWTFGSEQNQQCSTTLVLKVLQFVQANEDVQPAVNYAALIFTQRLCLICLCFFSSHRGSWDRMEKGFLSSWGGFRLTLLEAPIHTHSNFTFFHSLKKADYVCVCVLYLFFTILYNPFSWQREGLLDS